MKYHMVTSYGTDQEKVGNTVDTPMYGLGQCPTDAPPNLALVSNICQKEYEKYSKGYRIWDPTGNILFNANGKICVDNKNLLHNEGKMDLNVQQLMKIITY
eukprot:5465199-Ditylum_brightwellii.AAC.1